jgi:carbon-monoxide dehydrogenase medium subunit
MYPPKFDYYRASSVEEAISLMQEHQGKFMAGGHSLIPVMNLRLADPGVVIDIGRIDGMKGISVSGGSVRIGALTTHAMVAASGDVPAALSEAAGMIGDPQVRNRGTVGGNVSHADPASDLPTVLSALGATFHIQGPGGSRAVSADDFFVDLFMTALGDDDLLVAVEVPAANGSGSGYAKLFNPASRYAMVGAAAVVSADNGVCSSASVAVGGLTPKATKANSVSAALVGKELNDDNIAAAAAAVANDLGNDILSDIHADGNYRRAMAPVYVKRALMKAAERAS